MYKDKKIHFIGIGGISMSGLAILMKENGAIISGSDMQNSTIINNLKEQGINIFIGENPDLVDAADIVVYTAAIKESNKELVRAKKLNKELYERSKFLGIISKSYENVICISGTHGKSTTTGMISTIFLESKSDPTIHVGAILPKIHSNTYVGKKKYFIMEACEFVDSFLDFFPTCAVILNIDDDHLDYFKNIDNIKTSFSKFINLLPKNGNLVINQDDANTTSLDIPNNLNTLTYGINNNSNIMAKNITYNDLGYPEFDVYYNDALYTHIKLSVLGNHNIYNALASICVSIMYDIDKEYIKIGLSKYTGVERRFEYIGKIKDNVLIYDDYAHHPTEVKATLNSVKSVKHSKEYVIFQSHTYSRTKEHLKEFADVLSKFDNIVIAPIYPAREENIYNVHESDLVDLIKKVNNNVWYIDSFEKIEEFIKNNIKDNDLVITVGAGPVNKISKDLVSKNG